jgi:hypothetical protein
MPHDSNVTQQQGITMPHVAWVLLGKYLAVVNYDRLKRGKKAVNYRQLVGAILARMLVEHGQDIGRAFEEVWLERHTESLPHFYEPSQLAAIAAASRTDIPNVYRIGYRARQSASRRAQRALLGARSGSTSAFAGSPRFAGQVRGRGLYLATGFGFGKKKD